MELIPKNRECGREGFNGTMGMGGREGFDWDGNRIGNGAERDLMGKWEQEWDWEWEWGSGSQTGFPRTQLLPLDVDPSFP